MSTRIWLTSVAIEAIETKKENKHKDVMEDVSYLDGMEVKSDKGSKEHYIDLYFDPINPAESPPTIDPKHIKRVSFVDDYHKGLRIDGIYKLRDATARLETKRIIHSGYGYDANQIEEIFQRISISAGDIDTVREIYSKVRTGELKPIANWGISQHELEHREREATKKGLADDQAIAKHEIKKVRDED